MPNVLRYGKRRTFRNENHGITAESLVDSIFKGSAGQNIQLSGNTSFMSEQRKRANRIKQILQSKRGILDHGRNDSSNFRNQFNASLDEQKQSLDINHYTSHGESSPKFGVNIGLGDKLPLLEKSERGLI